MPEGGRTNPLLWFHGYTGDTCQSSVFEPSGVSPRPSCSTPWEQDNFGYDLAAVEAAKKKHEAIETDTAAYEERVRALEDLAQELEKENYHDQKRVTARKDNVLRLWSYLQELLQARRRRLETTLTLQKLFQDMLHSIDWMDEIKVGQGPQHPTN